MIGQRIGSYTIVEKLGEGGMGVVYRATDSRLHRDVALKFIPEAMAKDPQIMGRFEREAQVLASLNHPNIASIYGLEENAGQRALVMELAPGEELATRIARGKLPLEEALRIALAIAEALEAAHDKGIIHRDLKPANIKLGSPGDSGGGRLKILDFGLAKALQGELGTASGIDLTRSPTLSVAATQAGMILGTASYMSPEQARALTADRRADIWSFGVILYEMLAGRRAFLGDTVADTVAKVIEREPDWSLLPASTPPKVRELIERCLVKSPRQRLQAIGDARLVLEETLASLQRPLSVDAPPRPRQPGRNRERARRRGAMARWSLLGVIAAAALAWAAASALRPRPQAAVESPLAVEIVGGKRHPLQPAGRELRADAGWQYAGLRRERGLRAQALHPTAGSAPGDPGRHRGGEIERPLSSVRLSRRQLDRLRAAQRAAQGAGRRRRAAHRVQGLAQPGGHLARRRHHRVHSGSHERPVPRARGGRRAAAAHHARREARRGHPPVAACAPRRQARPLHLARRPPELRYRHPGGGLDRDRRAQGGVSGRQLRALRADRSPRCSSIAARCSRSRSISTRSRPAARRCRSSRRSRPVPAEGGAQYDFSATGRLVYGARLRGSHRLSHRVGRSRRPFEPSARRARRSTPTRASRPTARASRSPCCARGTGTSGSTTSSAASRRG